MQTKTIERCDSCDTLAELMYCKATHEHLCEDCIMALAIAYYEEQQINDEEAEKPQTSTNSVIE